ncbi:MAG: AAA family ATPase [Actinobacteria bacterium]|nr:AAA family ATPase [Actinomycetota bacterium]
MDEKNVENVFIAPCSTEHINKDILKDISLESGKGESQLPISIQGVIPIESIEDVLSEEEKKTLEKIYPDGKVKMWGTISESQWNPIKEGDLVVFYRNGKYICAADIVYKTHNPELARKVWGADKEETREYTFFWEYIFFVKNIRQLNVDRKTFNEKIKYEYIDKDGKKKAKYGPNFVPRSFMRIAEDPSKEKIIQLVKKISNKEDKPKSIDLIELDKELNGIMKLALAHLIAGKNTIFYGPPGTGKTYLARKICENICDEDNYSFSTANAEWSYFDVVGGFVLEGNGTKFKKGILLEAVEKCRGSLEKEGRPSWLIIDELNRANLDLAFGKTFTQLDIDYRDMPLEVIEENGEKKEFYMPYSFRILATMNTYDRAILFSLGYAFMRRFAFIPVGSLLKQHKLTPETELEISITEEMKEFASSDFARNLKELIMKVILEHFTKENGEDKAYIFEDFKVEDIGKINEIIDKLRFDGLDIVDVLLYIAHTITNKELVEIGHAILFDAAKFIVAYSQLSTSVDAREILDEAVTAYILPQIEYFMPKLRKAKVFGEKEYEEKWNKIKEDIKKLGLVKTFRGMEEAEKEFKVI